MDNDTLIRIIDRERAQGIGRADNVESDRRAANEFYMGEATGRLAPMDIEDRSRVVSKDMMDAIEWIMPSLMRMFASTDDIIKFEPQARGDEQACRDATQYCAYILNRANPGFIVLHDAIKSALITRTGVVKVYADDAWTEVDETYQDLDQLQMQALQADASVTVKEVVAGQQAVFGPDGAQVMMPTYTAVVTRRRNQRKFVVEGVPPEEVIFSKDTRDIEKLRFVCHEVERTKSDLISMGYGRADIEDAFGDESGYDDSGRDQYDGVDSDDDEPADESQKTVTLCEVCMRVDFDGDGIAEYRRIVKAGSVVFENDVTDDHPFALFTPVLMPYKLIGISFYDLLEDLQQIKTEITRQLIDGMRLSNNPRTIAVDGQVNLDDLLEARPGGVIRAKSLEAVAPFQLQDVTGTAQASLAYFNQVRDARSGVKDYTQGLIGGELSKSAIGSQGVAMLADAAAARIELIARVLAETGIARVYKLLLKLICQYQDDAVEVKINGHWMNIDPRAWHDDYTMTVSVGTGNTSQDKRMQRAQLLLQTQQGAAQFGLVQPQNALEGLTELCTALGFKDASKFFSMPQQQGEPQPSKEQMQMQLEQQKLAGQMQLEQKKQEAQAQESAITKQLESERDARDAQNQMALARYKMEQDAELARWKAMLDQDTAIKIARINAEARIAAAEASGAKSLANVNADMAYQVDNE